MAVASGAAPPIAPLWEGRILVGALGAVLTLSMAVILVISPAWVRQVELRFYDLMLSAARPLPPQSGEVVLVGIDEASLAAYGQWPWPRYRLARLLDRLREMGAQVVVLDALMPEPDRTSPDVIQAERQLDFGLRPTPPLPSFSQTDSNSEALARSLAAGPSIIGCYFDFSGGVPATPSMPAGMEVTTLGGRIPWPEAKGVVRSLPVLTAAAAEGFVNVRRDVDGILRRAPLLIRHGGLYYPSLALGAALFARPDRRLWLARAGGEAALLWGSQAIPLDRHGNMLITFRALDDAFPYLSAKSVLEDDAAMPPLSAKIVVVGPWAKALGDVYQVRDGRSLKGLEVHAAIVDNLVSGKYVAWPNWARGAELAALVLLGVASTWLLSRAGFLVSLLGVVVGSASCYLLGSYLLARTGVFIPSLLPMLTPVVVLVGLSMLKYTVEARKVRERNLDLMRAQTALEAVAEAKAELESANHKLAEVDRVKSMFIATMSHELRTPLNSIIGFSSLLLMGMPGPLNDEQQKQLGMVKNNALHLLDLIADIIDLSKIEVGQFDINMEDFDLAKMVRDSLASLRVAADQKSLGMDYDGPEQRVVRSDIRRVRQILVNLMGNAVKFTDKGGVTVTVREQGREVAVAVRDTGPGIRPEDMEKLFLYFSQVGDGAHKYEGTGLGLYLSRRLARLLGGDILVESEIGRGSVFTLILPVVTTEEGA